MHPAKPVETPHLFPLLLLLLLLPALAWARPEQAPAPAALEHPAFAALELLDLTYPGLELVAALHAAGDDAAAAEALLDYFRRRTQVVCPDFDPTAALTPEEQRWADEALEHRFFVHSGYQPSYFYGADIDWQYWPVKDNELRWQLHRMKWWVPMGKAYRRTGDGRYAAEWCAQYLDWIAKNPLTDYDPRRVTDWTEAPNVCFAWRPLETSDRLEFQIHQFLYFLPAEAFDGAFLLRFLDNYHRHAEHITRHFSAQGNHLLFEAQRLLYAGAFFPELRDAARWRRTAVDILHREIGVQVYDDGMQYELDPHYHLESIRIFFKALRMMEANGYRNEFPAGYLTAVEQMIEVYLNCSFPDGTTPLFSDNRYQDPATLRPDFRAWAEAFPDNVLIRRAADPEGANPAPEYLSRSFAPSGFHVLRNGWDAGATVLVLKAGPPAFWHCQPDNGTFELWHRGRNFFPDSGCYVYGGDSAVLAQRRWFRQTRVHNTLTLDDRSLERTDSKRLYWTAEGPTAAVAVENPSYEGLTHRRTVWFVEGRFFVLADEATGPAAGRVALHYHLLECDPHEDAAACVVTTRFADGNNLLLKVFGTERMERTEGRVSRTYRREAPRPSYAFPVHKQAGRPVRLITVLLPTEDAAAHRVQASWRRRGLRVAIDGKHYRLNLPTQTEITR